jgi:sulfite exporter TauE/SafE
MSSCGPLLISYVAGTRKNIAKSIIVYFIFSLARVFVYVVMGLSVFFLGKLMAESLLAGLSRYIYIIGGACIIIVGILMASGRRLESGVCRVLSKHVVEQDKKSIFVFGLIIGLLPCAPLIAVFSSVGLMSKSWLLSVGYTCAFGLGTVVSPLLFLIILAGFLPTLSLRKDSAAEKIFNLICGLIMIFLGARLVGRAF